MLTLGLVVLRVEPDERAALDVEPGRASRVGAVHAVEREVHAIGRFERCRRERAAVDLDRAELRLDDRAAAVVGAAVDRQRRALANVERVHAAAAFSLVGAVDAARRRVDHRVGVNIERRPVAGGLELARNRHRVRAEVDRDRNRDDRAVSRCRLRHIRREVREDVDHVASNRRVDRVLQRRVVRTALNLRNRRRGGVVARSGDRSSRIASDRKGLARRSAGDIGAVSRIADRHLSADGGGVGAVAVVRRAGHSDDRVGRDDDREGLDVQDRLNRDGRIAADGVGVGAVLAVDRHVIDLDSVNPVGLVRSNGERDAPVGVALAHSGREASNGGVVMGAKRERPGFPIARGVGGAGRSRRDVDRVRIGRHGNGGGVRVGVCANRNDRHGLVVGERQGLDAVRLERDRRAGFRRHIDRLLNRQVAGIVGCSIEIDHRDRLRIDLVLGIIADAIAAIRVHGLGVVDDEDGIGPVDERREIGLKSSLNRVVRRIVGDALRDNHLRRG